MNGVNLQDPYRWLEAEGKKTYNWIKKQNSYTENLINKIPVKRKLKHQLKKLYEIDSIGIPVPYNNRYFFIERKGSEDLSVLYFQDGSKGEPRVLIDQNKLF